MGSSDAVPETWRAALGPVLAAPEARQLADYVASQEKAGTAIYPPRGQRLAALELTPLDRVRVVILGQDPYHGAGQANGLAFSVAPGAKVPPSLANIYKELERDLGLPRSAQGDLTPWARQGVLLINAVLTVAHGQAASHAGKGWEAITDAIVAAVAAKQDPCVFMLWGNHARQKAQRVQGLGAGTHHLVLTAPHPSPLSAHGGWFGSGHFGKA
ncbi:uracil-DNA glycosylase, partial [Novosphingobium sp.]|uniref:uracil-DNA glycosylase n=1 Tax=Novosphingobium sp. TaxID=1874826 RepID=UPI0025D194E0